jgi:CRP/FNR family transcriptional regulator, cyclic AMP receptor protein
MRLSLQFPQLARAAFFEDIPAATVAQFIDACELRNVPSGTVVLEQHENITGMILIAHGCMEVSMRNSDDHVVIIHHAREGETLGDIETISRQPCLASCTAMGPVTFLFCPMSQLVQYMDNPLFQRNVMRITQNRLLRDNQRKYMDQNYSLDRRLCGYLLRLSDRNYRVPQSQGYIASLASCSRQSINRALAMLREEGLVTIEKGKIRLLDPSGLQRRLMGE